MNKIVKDLIDFGIRAVLGTTYGLLSGELMKENPLLGIPAFFFGLLYMIYVSWVSYEIGRKQNDKTKEK